MINLKIENKTNWEIQDWVEKIIFKFVEDNPQKTFLVCKIYSKKKKAYYCYDLEIENETIFIQRAYKEPVQIENEEVDKSYNEQKNMINTLDKELITLKQDMVDKSEGFNNEFSTMRNRMNNIERNLDLMKSEIKDLKTKFDKTFEKIMLIEEKIEHLEDHLEK
ncbi:MAG: hypothetical protein EAX96_20580 [Candidatus Lokiarchaeota archaeon]|nr:hypothetical protein [Candidatus Lokiarchaeota archaeon]